MSEQASAGGPDFAQGVDVSALADGQTLAGKIGDEPVLVSRRGEKYFAISGACTHYHGPLAEGLIDGDRVHCPWHHACFDLLTGEARAAPAFDALKRWKVDIDAGRLFVRAELPAADPQRLSSALRRVVIVGGGAAGFAAAEMLRRRGYDGALTMLSADADPPCDRPNLSKDYLAGDAPPEWVPLRGPDFYEDKKIDLKLSANVAKIDPKQRAVITASGETHAYDALLLATGASPIRLRGFDHPSVHTLRSVRDADALIAAASKAKRAVIIGAGFIGLEVAASLRKRDLEVAVVAPEATPMERVLGAELGRFLVEIHEAHGVRFHLGKSAKGFDGQKVLLDDGAIEADIVVMGVGVKPNVDLAANAGLKVSNGVEVDAFLRTSDPAIFAAGDIANFADGVSGERARVEHWVVAERQGQIAAINMLGGNERYDATPFFWSAHYDQTLSYVGYAPHWNKVEIDGAIAARDFTARYFRDGRLLAAVSLGRDHQNLEIERELDKARQAAFA